MTEQTKGRKLTTLCKVGRYEGRLEEAIYKSSELLKQTASPDREIRTFASFSSGTGPYFLMVSQKSGNDDLNAYIAVISYSDEKNKEVADRFKAETGVVLEFQREDLKRIISRLELLFPEFERNPGEVISLLGGKI